MNWKNLKIPALIAAIIVVLWFVLRNSGSQQPTVIQQPSTTSSGVPNYTTPNQQYNVSPATLSPSPLVSLFSPSAPNSPASQQPAGAPSGGPGGAPEYLIYNLGPGSALTKGKVAPTHEVAGASAGGGCCGSDACKPTCANNNQQFQDGQGNQCMAASKKKQIDSLEKRYPGLWQAMQSNLYEAGVDPNSVLMFWQQRDNADGTGNGPAGPGGAGASTAGNSRTWPGALVTGKIGHA